MKKLFSFLFLFFSLFSFSQESEYVYFIHPTTNQIYRNFFPIQVEYNSPIKFKLKIEKPSSNHSNTTYSWSIKYNERVNNNRIKLSYTSQTFYRSGDYSEVLITLENMGDFYSENKIILKYTGTESSGSGISYDLEINVKNVPKGGITPENPNPPLTSIGSGSCSNAPTGLYQTSIGNTHTFNWNPVSGSMPYTIAIREDKNVWSYFTTNTNNYSIALSPSKQFFWAVRANCKLWSEEKLIKSYNKCNENLTYNNATIKRDNIQANNLLTISNSIVLGSTNVRAKKILIKNSRITDGARIYVQGCGIGSNIIEDNDQNNILYENYQSEVNDSIAKNNIVIQETNVKTKTVENNFTISPNPTSNQVQINSTIGINEWFVYDINAKTVLSGNNKNGNNLKINLQQLNVGLYYFKFSDSSGIIHEKTIIKK